MVTEPKQSDFSEIPLIDVSRLGSGREGDIRSIAVELRQYLATVGFLYVSGHAVPRESIDAVREMNRRFHALPLAEKLKLKIDRNFRGYLALKASTIVTSSVATVSKPNQSESMMFMHEIAANDPACLAGEPLQGPNQWPDDSLIAGFRGIIETYVAQMTGLARRLADAIALSLDMPPQALAPYFARPTTFLRLLHYPTQPDEPGLFGSAPHTDYGFITLLAQDDVGGLEVRNKDGHWVAAPPVPDTFVMNVGDILARWSNDTFVSTPHRVINRSGRERYSQPFFFDPSMNAKIETFATCVSADKQSKYTPVVYGDYLLERIDKNYHHRQRIKI